MKLQKANTILDLVGNTPIVHLQRLPAPDSADLWAKLESANPGGSVKDRIAKAMIEAAEESGLLESGQTIVEPTSGSTGIGLAMTAAVKGYPLPLTMPDTMSAERRTLLAAFGAELVLTPGDKGMKGAIEKAEELARERGYFMPQPFDNPANPEVHRRTPLPRSSLRLETWMPLCVESERAGLSRAWAKSSRIPFVTF